MIEINNLTKRFGKNLVLNNINLDIKKGEIVTLIGQSGAGKTTLLRTLNWLEKPTEGTIQIGKDKIDANSYSKDDVRNLRSHSSMVFQHYNLFKNKTVLENVTESLITVKKMKRSLAEDKALSVLQRVGMESKANDYPSRLSGGQQQRVGIARALANDPEIMLFDEPTSALDPEWVSEVLDVIQDIAQDGMTMVMVSHEMNFVRNVSSRVLFLDNASIIEDSTPTEMFQNPKHERTINFLNRILQQS